MNKKFKITLSLTATTIFFIFSIWFIKGNWNDFSKIKDVSVFDFVLLATIALVYVVAQGLILKEIVVPFNIRLKWKEWFGIVIVTLLGNYIVPFGGLGFRGAYLKTRYSFDYTHFLSTLSIVYLLEFLVFTFGGLFSLVFLYYKFGFFDLFSAILLSVILVTIVILFFNSHLIFLPKTKLFYRINNMLDSWRLLVSDRNLLKKIFFLTFLEFFIFSSLFYFVLISLNFKADFLQSFLPACFSDYASIIRLLPASLGFHEGAVTYAYKISGYSVVQGLLVAGIIRVVLAFWIFLLGPIFSFVLIKRSKQ